MYKLKQIPDDFIVEEITNIKPTKGHYRLYWMTKTNINTQQAVDFIARRLNIQKKFIGYAGTKDKNAVTTQLISIKCNKNPRKIKNIYLKLFGNYDKALALGNLEGNKFKITIRNLNHEIDTSKSKFINYFGEQRFSKNNVEIGKLILQNNYKKAINLIIENEGFYEKKIKLFLEKNENNYIGALKLIDKNILKFYIHAYQSNLWNECAKNGFEDIPLVGFGTNIPSDMEDFIKEKLSEDNLTLRSFIVKSIPFLSSEGGIREKYFETNITTISFQEDDLNEDKFKQEVTFTLPKGSYATEVIKQLF